MNNIIEKIKQNKKVALIIGIVLVLVIIDIVAPKKSQEEQDNKTVSSNKEITTEAVTEKIITETTVAVTEEAEVNETSEPEHNTSAYVDYLALKAKEDAETATDEDIAEALQWLIDNTENYFSGNENMEKTMYYGELLEYKYKNTGDDLEKIGWQAFKTVKYVYRGAESVLDDVTHDNLMELKEMLENYQS